MRFPKRIKHRGRVFATIYNKSEAYPMCRVVYSIHGKRRMKAFDRFGGKDGANEYAEGIAKDLAKGSQASALASSQATDALEAFELLERFRKSSGVLLSLVSAVSQFVDASSKLSSHSIGEAIDGFLRNTARVKRKALSEALDEFRAADEPRTRAKDGGRAQLSAEYFRVRGILLN